MKEADRKRQLSRIRLGLFIIFALAYLSGALSFGLEFHNYWACAGFSFAVLFIILRIGFLLTPQYRLYQIFPPCSFNRAAYQTFFFATGLAGIVLGVWLMARGIQLHQSWTATSYFCGMIGMWMGAKWAFFLTIPMYELREDTLEEEALVLLGLVETDECRHADKCEPTFMEEERV